MSRRLRRAGTHPTDDGSASINLPPFITSTTLSTSDIGQDAFTVEFTRATDDITAPEDLVYKLYKSDSENLSDVDDILANGSLVGQVTGTDESSYSIQITGLSLDETVYFNVIVEDEDGLKTSYTQNFETTVDVDEARPSPTLSSGVSDPTNASPVSVSIDFGEVVTGLAIGDIAKTNAALQNLVNIDGQNYTVELVPDVDGVVTIQVPANVVTDNAGNLNTASNIISFTYDATAPVPVITSSADDPTETSPIPVSVDFGENVTGFVIGDLDVSGGNPSNFTDVDGQNYTFDITPASDPVDITVDIAQGVATDDAGNSNDAATQFAITFTTAVGPKPTVSSSASSPTGTSPIPIEVDFGEEVGGFVQSDITIVGATISGFTDNSDGTYDFNATPSSDPVVVTVNIPEGVANDADDNPNQASDEFSITYDTNIPQGDITSTESDPTNENPVPISIDFGVDVTGFAQGDLNVSGGSVSNFTNTNDQVYTFDITPDSTSEDITVDIPADVCQSIASGTSNIASDQFSITYDGVSPDATITSSESDPTNASPIPVTIQWDEDVTGFSVGDLDVGNGSASNFTQVDADTYTVDITPSGIGNVTVDIGAGVCLDTAGNSNSAATQFVIVYDNQDPTVSDDTLSVSDKTETSFNVNFTKAIDNISSQPEITYVLYTSDSNNIDTVANAEANGTEQDFNIDVSQLTASGFSSGEEVWFNVVARDEAGNKLAYTQNSTITDDNTDPVISSSTISVNNRTTSSFTVEVVRATDNATAQGDLVYKLYYSTGGPLTTLSEIDSNGVLADSGADKVILTASGRQAGTTYPFNVTVEDESGNRSLYTQGQVTTLEAIAIENIDFTLSLLGSDLDFALEGMFESEPTDETPPTIADPSLTINNVDEDSIIIFWDNAEDDETAIGDLSYTLFRSTSGNIDTVANAEANGTNVGQFEAIVEGEHSTVHNHSFAAETEVWFNFVVYDEAGNASAYTMNSVTTPAATTGLDSRAGDEAALEDLNSSLSGLPSGWSSNISLSSPPTGVTVDTIGGELRVTVISLMNEGLTGSIDNASIGNLKEMTKFNVMYNSINSQFPQDIGNCVALEYLYLNMSNNVVDTGTEPHSDSSFVSHPGKNAGTLQNTFTGPIPSSIGNLSNLKWIVCEWSEVTSVPNELFNCTNLEGLRLYHMPEMSPRSIPTTIGNLTSLQDLVIGAQDETDFGHWIGSVPSEITNCTSIKNVWLDRTELGGTLPEFGGSNLHSFLVVKMLSFPSSKKFSGSYPTSLADGSHPNLNMVSFAFNELSGDLPAPFGTMNLKQFSLGWNDVTGDIPNGLVQNHNQLTTPSFDNTQMSGIANIDWTNLNNVRQLRMNDSLFSGQLPYINWGSSAIDNFADFRRNKFNFADMLYSPPNASGTVYSLWNSEPIDFDIFPQKRLGNANTIDASVGESSIDIDDFQGVFTHGGNSYQWRKNGSNISDGSKYSGTNTKVLTINNLASGDTGNYDLVVTNSATGSNQILSQEIFLDVS